MSAIVLATADGRIPGWVNDLKSFRRWAQSKDFPRRGWFSFLGGDIWVDTSMDELVTHNLVKTEYTVVLGGLVRAEERGYFFSDRASLTNSKANLSTEPHAFFVSFDAVARGRARFGPAAKSGYREIAGTPEMVLEIASEYSVYKDTNLLRDFYWQAGIEEYWLVDVRKATPRFDILRRSARGCATTRKQAGWIRSNVFGRSFLLECGRDRLGHQQYTVKTK
jgi:Uma2 family endonuclease